MIEYRLMAINYSNRDNVRPSRDERSAATSATGITPSGRMLLRPIESTVDTCRSSRKSAKGSYPAVGAQDLPFGKRPHTVARLAPPRFPSAFADTRGLW